MIPIRANKTGHFRVECLLYFDKKIYTLYFDFVLFIYFIKLILRKKRISTIHPHLGLIQIYAESYYVTMVNGKGGEVES